MKRFLFILALTTLHHGTQAQGAIGLQLFAAGLNAPVDIANAGDARLFVVEQDGIIKIIQPNGVVHTTAFLNIQNLTNASGERGLLGLAFDPNYTTNGYFYVNYTTNNGSTVIARYQVSSTNPNRANPASAVTLLTINQPFSNHNGGCIKFGPDGFLYIGMGDGGSANDPQNFAQNLTVPATNPSRVFLGKMLRINVTNNNIAPYYTIPASNPFVGQASREEIWALGLRNPWRFSFDAVTGDLWIGDVGQGLFEEINRSSTSQTTALNYGWRCYEGNNPFNTAGCPGIASLEQPLVSISHSNGSCSVTGGAVYRGSAYTALQGYYVFSDFCFSRLGLVDQAGALRYSQNFPGKSFSAFGVNNSSEMFVASLNTGEIFAIIGTLGIDNVQLPSLVLVPNPVKNELTIQNAADLNIEKIVIYDLAGRLFLEQPLGANVVINVANFNAGLYYLAGINAAGLRTYSKFIVE